MGGHRRISTALFLEHAERRLPRSKVEALLELDLDTFKGTVQGERRYAALWGWSREKVRNLLAQYRATLGDLSNGDRTTDRTTARPDPVPATDHQNRMDSRAYVSPPTVIVPHTGPPTGPPTGHFLEPDPDPEGRSAPPHRASALKVGRAEAKTREAEREIARALMKAGVETPERRAERTARLDILSDMFLASGRVADEATLRTYFRTTEEVPTAFLRSACDRAFSASEKGFAPPPSAIVAAGRSAAIAARRLERERGEGARA